MAIKEKSKNGLTTNIEIENDVVIQDSKSIKNCFIITPIGNEDDPIRRHIEGVYNAALEPVLRECGYTSNLPHKILTPGSITRQIIKSIYDSDLIIVNLTNINPNVMYELALTHCFNKPTIIIAEDGTELPFDIIDERILFYINDPEGVFKLQKDLKEALNELHNKKSFKSTVVSCIQEFKFDELLKDNKEDTQNSPESFEMLVRRLDRIEHSLRRINTCEKSNGFYRGSRTYIIYQPDDSEYEVHEKTKELSEKFRKRNIIISRFYNNKKCCTLSFKESSPRIAELISMEIEAFCQSYNFVYESIYENFEG